MADTELLAEDRTEFGKGAARRIRRADKIPAVIYGHGMEPVHVTLPGHTTMLALKHKNALLTINVEGKESHLTVVKGVQRDPIKRFIEHVDLLVVRRGEKISVSVPVRTKGDAGPGTMVSMESSAVKLKVEATHIPEEIVVDIAGLTAGSSVHARDLNLPEGSVLDVSEDLMIINITEEKVISEESAADGAADGDAAEATEE